MRHTHPLNADENAVDQAMRKLHRSHEDQDRALSEYRLALRFKAQRADGLQRVANLLLGEVPYESP